MVPSSETACQPPGDHFGFIIGLTNFQSIPVPVLRFQQELRVVGSSQDSVQFLLSEAAMNANRVIMTVFRSEHWPYSRAPCNSELLRDHPLSTHPDQSQMSPIRRQRPHIAIGFSSKQTPDGHRNFKTSCQCWTSVADCFTWIFHPLRNVSELTYCS